jgi:PTH1 family peptidyl-tRNA hydrolase
MIRLFAFLGNTGKQYTGNRHNVAWQFFDSCSCFGELIWKSGFKAHWSQSCDMPVGNAGMITPEEKFWIIKPDTFMNCSGESVGGIASFFKIKAEEILVVHDELELSFGIFGFKSGGGLGGHNGLRSIKEQLGTADFQRLRFGIGRPNHDDISGYVLSDFANEEKEILWSSIFPSAEKALQVCIEQGFDEALKDFNKVNCLK